MILMRQELFKDDVISLINIQLFLNASSGQVQAQVSQLCLTLGNPVASTVCGILQARVLEWVAFPFFATNQP